MARLDRVKNLTGLVEWYGKNARLRELVHLVVVGGDRRKECERVQHYAHFVDLRFPGKGFLLSCLANPLA